MTFKFEGKEYRIAFMHELPRAWEAHKGHNVSLAQHNGSGATVLFCRTCSTANQPHCTFRLSHVPEAQRQRRTHCTISVATGEVNEDGYLIWKTVANGVSQVNVKAGDRFSRAGGRHWSLTHALEQLSVTDPEISRVLRLTANIGDILADQRPWVDEGWPMEFAQGKRAWALKALDALIASQKAFRAAAWHAYLTWGTPTVRLAIKPAAEGGAA
jgi:hypothetical protein